jgi:hypothetical protein
MKVLIYFYWDHNNCLIKDIMSQGRGKEQENRGKQGQDRGGKRNE